MILPLNISRIDRLGTSVSSVCAIHCAIMPFAVTTLSFLGFGFLADERVERTILLVSIALASASVCWGIRIHGQRRILLLFGAALLLIVTGREFAEGPAETAFVVLGSTLFTCGHVLNHNLCQSCRRCGQGAVWPN
jgi:MerC mercury resistance protein